MRQNQYGEWEVVPPGDPEYDRDRFGWHLDPLEIDELVLREKRDLMAGHLYADIELKATNLDGVITVMMGQAYVTNNYRDDDLAETYLTWSTEVHIEVTPAPLKEPTTIGARVVLDNGSKWIRVYPSTIARSHWICYSHSNEHENGQIRYWIDLNGANPKLVTD